MPWQFYYDYTIFFISFWVPTNNSLSLLIHNDKSLHNRHQVISKLWGCESKTIEKNIILEKKYDEKK